MVQAADSEGDEFKDLIRSIHYSPIATILTDNRRSDNPIIDANDAFVELTGYGREEIIGRNCRFLAGPGTEPQVQASVRSAIARGEPIVAELTNYRKDGTPFRNALMIAPVCDSEGHIRLFIGSQMDVGIGEGAGLRETRSRDMVRRLTPRMKQVLELMSAGYRNKQIGGALGIGEKTVKMHRARLMEALGVKTSAEAIRIALEANLLSSDPDRLQSGQ
jgi:PAS domain S-box-containing protein